MEPICSFLGVQDEILGYLEKACQLIPDEKLAAECKETVDNYYPIVIGIIAGELVSVTPPGLFLVPCKSVLRAANAPPS